MESGTQRKARASQQSERGTISILLPDHVQSTAVTTETKAHSTKMNGVTRLSHFESVNSKSRPSFFQVIFKQEAEAI